MNSEYKPILKNALVSLFVSMNDFVKERIRITKEDPEDYIISIYPEFSVYRKDNKKVSRKVLNSIKRGLENRSQ
jgi:hypothetical protein